MHNGYNPTIVVGWDGATFTLLEPWMRQGLMPNLAKLAGQGIAGNLLSVFPPVSAPAWASFVTGKHPGKHGFITWQRPMRGGQEGAVRELCNMKNIYSARIWHYMNRYGKRVGFINVPITYPPDKVDAFFVSGMLTPSLESEFTYPATLYKEKLLPHGNYKVDLDWANYGPQEWDQMMHEVMEMTDVRHRATMALMEEYKPDLLTVVYTSVDRLQHFIWHNLDETHPDHKPEVAARYRPTLMAYFKQLDDILGEMRQAVGEDAPFLLISDHGFGNWHTRVNLNVLLATEGMLSSPMFRKTPALADMTQDLRDKLMVRTRLRTMAKRIGVVPDFLKTQPKYRASIAKTLEAVQWDKTMAYSGTRSEYGVYVNLKGREPNGIVEPGQEYEQLRDRIIKLLTEIKDPANGNHPFRDVHRREELFDKDFLNDAPDVCFDVNPGYEAYDKLSGDRIFEEVTHENQHGTGQHRPEGILVAGGAPFKQGVRIKDVSIVDMAPTLLYLSDAPIPTDMDGKIIEEAFLPEYLAAHQAQSCEPLPKDISEGGGATYSDEEDETVRGRLMDLGYFG